MYLLVGKGRFDEKVDYFIMTEKLYFLNVAISTGKNFGGWIFSIAVAGLC
jgi:hypothetical protein